MKVWEVCLTIVLLLAGVVVYAEMMEGKDPNNEPRVLATDTTGRLYVDDMSVDAPSATSGTAVAGSPVVVLSAGDIQDWPNWCVYLKNAGGGGGGPLTDADVQVSPDNIGWISLTWTTCDALASGGYCVYCVTGSSYRYVRVRAKAAAPANDTTVDAWITKNRG